MIYEHFFSRLRFVWWFELIFVPKIRFDETESMRIPHNQWAWVRSATDNHKPIWTKKISIMYFTLFKVMLEPEFISMILLHEIEYAHGSINVWTVSFRMQSHAYLIAFTIHNFFTCVLRAIIFLQYPRKYLHILGDMNGWKMDCGNCATCRHNNKILSALCISTVVCAYSMLNHVIFARQNVYCHKLRRKMPIKQCEIE